MSRTQEFLQRLTGRAGEQRESPPELAAPENTAPTPEAPASDQVGKGRAARWPSDMRPSPSGFWGRIEKADGGVVRGWMFSPRPDVSPVLLVDGKPARLIGWPLPRPELQRALGSPHPVGFTFRLDGAVPGDRLELHAFTGRSLEPLHHRIVKRPSVTLNVLEQLERAAELASDPACVAITCWESAHNPVGRARVLYDVARTRGPAVILSYRFEEFGKGLWPPLRGADVDLVQIPWRQRELYHGLIEDMELSFRTVWLCKPRLPTFLLAAQVAHPDARLVLDMDDNEEHFSTSAASHRRVYGLPGLARARLVAADVPARTVASASLQEDFGGHLVRHVRRPGPRRKQRVHTSPAVEAKLAFVGTVRPHKNILPAAKAIGMVNWSQGRSIRLHVLGDVSPPELRAELKLNGAVVGGMIPVSMLPQRLSAMDCLLAGFPSDAAGDDSITRYQISAKIGDALAVGKPILVPESASVRDLADVPGVYLFNQGNFADQLGAALDSDAKIRLPDSFTPAGAAHSFDHALHEAGSSPRAGQVLASLRATPTVRGAEAAPRDVLLLIWKQHDAGLYGRRVDQVARAYKRLHPTSEVVVLELLHPQDEKRYAGLASDVTSDAAQISRLSARKRNDGHVDRDGVRYRQLEYHTDAAVAEVMQEFLAGEAMLPSNTRVVLFPIVAAFAQFAHLLRTYATVVDVVDNQFSWAQREAQRWARAWQYSVVVKGATNVVFNSEANRQFFVDEGIIAGGDPRVSVVPNWYLPPPEPDGDPRWAMDRRHPTLVYTGNMNDRIDWGLLSELSERMPNSRILLVGGASRVGPDFDRVIQLSNVAYLGPLDEAETLRVLDGADVAVVPHLNNDVSAFMNPLKLRMYQSRGLPTVVTEVPGIGDEHHLLVVARRDKFVDEVERVLSERESTTAARPAPSGELTAEAREYLRLLRPTSDPGKQTSRPLHQSGDAL